MSNVTNCLNKYCLYCNDEECTLDSISINDDGECDNYECYTETREYQEPYFICFKADKKKHSIPKGLYKEKRYGKKLSINGRTYYTEDDTRNENFGITDVIAGVRLDKAFALKEDINTKIAEHLKEHGYDDVTELLEVEKEFKNGTYVYVIVEERVIADE